MTLAQIVRKRTLSHVVRKRGKLYSNHVPLRHLASTGISEEPLKDFNLSLLFLNLPRARLEHLLFSSLLLVQRLLACLSPFLQRRYLSPEGKATGGEGTIFLLQPISNTLATH